MTEEKKEATIEDRSLTAEEVKASMTTFRVRVPRTHGDDYDVDVAGHSISIDENGSLEVHVLLPETMTDAVWLGPSAKINKRHVSAHFKAEQWADVVDLRFYRVPEEPKVEIKLDAEAMKKSIAKAAERTKPQSFNDVVTRPTKEIDRPTFDDDEPAIDPESGGAV